MRRKIKPIPTSVILAAVDGDSIALASIINHYKGYIYHLALRPVQDEFGKCYLRLDDNMRLRLEAKLIASIVTKFKVLEK